MRLFIKMLRLSLNCMLILILFAGCNSTNEGMEKSYKQANNFNFVLNYGVNAKNQINTIEGKYTKDMVDGSTVNTNLKLTDEEIDRIYSEMNKISILDYPELFEPKEGVLVTPFESYSLRVIINDKEKHIYWEDKSLSKTKEADQLRQLFENIQLIIINKDEYKKLPEAKGGYM